MPVEVAAGGTGAFIAAGILSLGGHHHEIYLSDPRQERSERMRNRVRQPVV